MALSLTKTWILVRVLDGTIDRGEYYRRQMQIFLAATFGDKANTGIQGRSSGGQVCDKQTAAASARLEVRSVIPNDPNAGNGSSRNGKGRARY
jgi:hypothetical protein